MQAAVGAAGAVGLPVVGFFSLMSAPIYGKGWLPGTGGLVNFAELTARTSPNEYLVAPRDACPNFKGSREDSRVYPVTVPELKKLFSEMLKRRYAISLFAEPTLQDGDQYVYVERTPLLRFPDIINVEFLPVGDSASTLIIHSGSVYGYSDLGKNKQRVTEMLRDLANLPFFARLSAVQV